MAGTDPDLAARLDAARSQLQATIAAARASLEAARRTLGPTREELAELQERAARGELGAEMEELAGHVAAGRTSWSAVFDGSSPYAHLLAPHLQRMAVDHAETVRAAIEDDHGYDKSETSPGV